MPEPADLTAVLVDGSPLDPVALRRVVAGYGDGWLRVRPLDGLGLTQVELLDPAGLPRIDPALVVALSDGGRRAAFVHVNHGARQAIAHWFVDGKEVEGWVGEPRELDERLARAVGRSLAELTAADDGTRRGFGNAASATVALVRGRALEAPVGTATSLGSFAFHDRNGRGGADRVALLAFDGRALEAAWNTTPGAELAARVATLPAGAVGPLGPVREAAVGALAALGDRTPVEAGLRSVVALELTALADTFVWGAGEAVSWVDQRLLPMFSLASGDPAIDEAEEAEELESRASVLEAMTEVLPYASPEGAVLEQIADDELGPLAPWAAPGEEYVGSLFRLRGERLRGLIEGADGPELAARVDRFYRAWWRAGHDEPTGPAFEAWRAELDRRGAADLERFVTGWAEWRTVLALASANGLETALLFYGVAGGHARPDEATR